MRAFGFCAVLSGCLTLAGCLQQASLPPDVSPAPLPAEPPEQLPVTIRTSWPALLAAVDGEIPRCTGAAADGTCPDSAGADAFIFREEEAWTAIDQRMLGQPLGIKIAVWRSDPVAIAVAGTTITASLKLHYRVRVGLMSGRQLASCGVGETPRDMTVTFAGDVSFDPDWSLDPDFVVDVAPGARCAVSLLNVDLTDRVIAPVREALQKEADEAAERIRGITDIRRMAADLWTRLAQPVAIGERLWLQPHLTNAHVRLPAITPDGRFLATTIGIEGFPRIVVGHEPPAILNPLPPLAAGPVDPDFSIRVRGLVDYAEAGEILAGHLDAALRRESLRGLRLAGVTVSGRGDKVVIALKVRGALSATLYFFGVPRFEAVAGSVAGGRLTLDDPRFTFTANGPLTGLMISLFRARIEAALATSAWWDATPDLQAAVAALRAALNRDLTPRARLEGRLTSFGPGEVRVGPEGLEAWYRVGGSVGVAVAPFD